MKTPADALRPRLIDRSLDATLAAVDALAALPADALEPLFEGVGAEAAPDDAAGCPSLRRSAYFTGRSGPEQAWLDQALLRLAPRVADRVPAARALTEADALRVDGGASGVGVSLPVEFLASYTRLARLALTHQTPSRLDALASLPALREVTLLRCGIDAGTAALRACPRVESLTLSGCAGVVYALGPWPSLRTLRVIAPDGPHPLVSFEGLDALETLRVERLNADDLTSLAALPALRRLELPYAVLRKGLAGVERCAGLRALDLTASNVSDPTPLAALTALESLSLRGCWLLAGIAPLSALRSLRALDLHNTQVTWLGSLRGLPLESLDLTNAPVRDLEGLRGCATLRALEGARAGDASPLAGCAALESLALTLTGPQDLAWMARMERLRAATIAAPGLADLRGVEGCRALTSLTLEGCAGVKDLSPLAGLASLEWLSLRGARSISDLSPLSSLPRLARVDLRDCASVADASPLWSVGSLRLAALAGTGVAREAVPKEHRHRASFAREPDFERALRPPEPPKPRVVLGPKGQGAAARKRFSAVRAQLNAKDLDVIEQGAELLAALGDAGLFDELVAGATWTDCEASVAKKAAGGFTPPPSLGAAKTANAYQTAALLALVSRAPEGAPTARGLRDAVRSLLLGGRTIYDSAPVDLGPLRGLPNLTRLHLRRPSELRHPEALGALAGVTALTLEGVRLDLERAPMPPKLASLTVASTDATRIAFPGHTTLTTLRVTGARAPVELALARCAALHTLSIQHAHVKRLDVTGCAALRSLELTQVRAIDELAGAESLTALRRLEILVRDARAALARLPTRAGVEHLVIESTALAGLDEALAGCTGLRTLRFQNCCGRCDFSVLARAPRLARVEFRQCSGLGDLEALAALPALGRLKLHGSPAAVPESLRGVLEA